MINKFLVSLAYFVKGLNLPHKLKYLFFLLVRRRQIKVKSFIYSSKTKIELNIGEFIGYWIFMDGSYEENWIKNIIGLVKDKTFIDIGANVGIYTLSLFKQSNKVYAFEPEQENYNALINNLRINFIKNVETFKTAISNKNNKKLSLYIKKENMGLSSLKIPYPEGEQIVDSITLDSFIKNNKVKNIGLIKIDVEGSELDVLDGGFNTLHKIGPPVLIELNGPILKILGKSPFDIYKVFKDCGYNAFKVKNDILVPFEENELLPSMNYNVLFLK